MQLNEKVIIVTGSSGLLGREFCRKIEDAGGHVIRVDIKPSDVKDTDFIECDIRNLNEIDKVINIVISKYGRIDGLVNNAYPRTSDWGMDFLHITDSSLEQNINWQLNSHILFSQKVISYMMNQNNGSIINIASIYGIVGNDFTLYEGTKISPAAPYAAIKGGIINFTRFLASQFGQYGIRVNCVSPGGIFDNQDNKFVSAYQKRVPLKRMGNPQDISPSVVFLLSDDSKYITGHNLVIDGGWTAI
ncbi:MAG: SDR family oxidoreductase [Ignavibacteriaceae bacterium]|nr:SDR family oxidoreductase [Ignavibacteriaceae bacterium]